MSPKREAVMRTVAVLAVLYATYWIVWRWTNTLNPDPAAVVPSVLLLLAETWAYINMLLFVFLVWRLQERDPGPAPAGRSVDVFITCYDEPLEVLRRTAIGARGIRYPHRTYLLDDGKREEMRALAEELGIGYIRRVGNANAKAGNLNFALSVTSGEFILQLDADHVPLPDILDRMLGHFNDPRVAVVQSPQDFYNTDSFTHVVNDEGRRLWEENRIFYSLIQPGRDRFNASFFCGSCGVLRRSALEEIGGFATETIIEDMETTMRLQARGWKSAYHAETLAYGLAPHSASAYHVQRLRWGQGSMQILKKLTPLTMPGLTLAQRINYFAGTATYLEGWQKAIFYLTPLLFFFTGLLPVAVNQTEFLLRLVPYLVLSIAAFELLSRGTGYLFIAERYTMLRFFTYMLTVSALFARKPLKFNVTPKGRTGVPFRSYAPQLVLFVLSLVAPVFATVANHYRWIDYGSNGWGSVAFWANGLWVLWNCHFAWFVVRHSLKMRQEREDHRFAEHMPVTVEVDTSASTRRLSALISDLNPAGVRFRSTERLDAGTEVMIELPLAGGRVRAAGEVRHVSPPAARAGEAYDHGVAFHDLPVEARDLIEVHCTQHAMPTWRLRYRQSIDIMTRAAEVMRNKRGERRDLVRLPVSVSVLADDGASAAPEMLILEELSRSGARLLGTVCYAPGTLVTFQLPGGEDARMGVVRYVNAHRTTMAVSFTLGVQLVPAGAPLAVPVAPVAAAAPTAARRLIRERAVR